LAVKTLIIGCGYLGLPLALRRQAEGDEIAAWVHSHASAEALGAHGFSRVIAGSVAEEELWRNLPKFDRVVHCASSGGRGVEGYREVFVKGARLMAEQQPEARRLLVSSTSVYGQTLGEIVTEESAAEPAVETGNVLREAEEIARKAGAIVVRSAGIYGPGRGVLLEKLRRGEAVIEGDGRRWINEIHRDDLVSAVAHLLEVGEPGAIYNASDDEPVTQVDYYRWCSGFLGVPMPPFGPVKEQRKRGLTNKRVSNAKLRGTGWSPQFPSFREGLANGTKK
jgi:nucleoside-diphosphate-sugar epimerase